MVKMAGIINKKGVDEISKLRVVCECGHILNIPVQKDYAICSHCNKKVKNTTLEHFKYNILKRMK